MSKTAYEKHEDEVREIQLRNHEDRLVHRPAEVHQDVVVDALDKDGEPTVEKVGEIHVVGGKAFIEVKGEFGRQDLPTLANLINTAVQAVQV
jgi:hypothetical protein